ncbi:stealth conserved region 3 domain-containing protein [Glutamicibacter ardleyensis]
MLNLGIRGWRGRVGRKLPDSFWERILKFSLRKGLDGSEFLAEIRQENFDQSRQLAIAAGVTFADNSLPGVSYVSKSNWNKFAYVLRENHFILQQLPTEVAGFGALQVWSVFSPGSASSARDGKYAGLGAIWAVYSNGKSFEPDIQDFIEPIDAVYTWVDSSDPKWRSSYHEYKELIPAGISHASSRDLARYTSRDELKYSLRSLEMNLPWIRNIYIVSAGQVPEWLKSSHSKITIIDHEEIFSSPEDCLPTFNSHAIETQISRIDGLSEHFIYVNDDIFFGRPLSPNTFYTGGGHVRYSLATAHFCEASNPQLAVNLAAKRNEELIHEKYGRTTALKFRHVAHPQLRAVHDIILDDFSEFVESTARHKFRDSEDISVPSSLAHYVAAAEGLGVPVEIDYAYVDLGREHLAMNLIRLIRNNGRQMFCLNEVSTASENEHRGQLAKEVLDSLFPYKSSFEV